MEAVRALKAVILAGMITLSGCGTGENNAGAPVRINQTVEYYDITGTTETELRDQMNEKGIRWSDGSTYYSVTYWNFHWNYGFDCRSSADCSIGSFAVQVDIKFVYPRWTPPAGASAQLVSEWNTFIKNIVTHENGHRDLAVAAADDMSGGALNLPAAGSGSLDSEVQAYTTQVLAKLNADESAYDVTTMHGATQGAVFP